VGVEHYPCVLHCGQTCCDVSASYVTITVADGRDVIEGYCHEYCVAEWVEANYMVGGMDEESGEEVYVLTEKGAQHVRALLEKAMRAHAAAYEDAGGSPAPEPAASIVGILTDLIDLIEYMVQAAGPKVFTHNELAKVNERLTALKKRMT